jgi:hypothetical protein
MASILSDVEASGKPGAVHYKDAGDAEEVPEPAKIGQ